MKTAWGTITSAGPAEPGVHGLHDVKLRKPHFADVDSSYGSRLKPQQIESVVANALRHAANDSARRALEQRLSPGFEKDLFLATISDDSQDRYGDRIAVEGWQLEQYMKNPVLMGFHDYESPSVGQALDVFPDYQGERPRLRGLFLWSDVNPMAKLLKAQYEVGEMRAFSVGFIPDEFRIPKSDDERRELDLGENGVLHLRQTLLENSAVPVPANPNAVQDGVMMDAYRKSLTVSERQGLRKLAERVAEVDTGLSQWIREFVPRGQDDDAESLMAIVAKISAAARVVAQDGAELRRSLEGKDWDVSEEELLMSLQLIRSRARITEIQLELDALRRGSRG